MRAGWYEKYGPAREVIQVGELDTPEAGPGEVRVRLHASGANPTDVKSRMGSRGPWKHPLIVPHSDGAGVIDQTGEGVDAARAGERVWVYNGQWERPMGTAAEYITLPAAQAVRLPAGVDFAQGACLAIPAMTAHRCLFSDGPIAGQTVLVTGGAGAVGHYAVQLAKWRGARVFATVSTGEKGERAREAGADLIVYYRSEDVAAKVLDLTCGAGVDRIVDVDFGENVQTNKEILKNNGTIAAYASSRAPEPALPFYAYMRFNANVRLCFVYTIPDEAKRSACEDIVRACEEGALTHLIGERFPLDRLAEAHEAIESDARVGNVVVDIG
ncbi:MAG: NADPH:quinone reductase [bacterium]